MNTSSESVEYALEAASTMSPNEIAELIARLAEYLAEEQSTTGDPSNPFGRVDPKGILKGITGITDEDIDEVRREMWESFPRDIGE